MYQTRNCRAVWLVKLKLFEILSSFYNPNSSNESVSIVPTGHIMKSTHHTHLPFHLPKAATLAHVMPSLDSGSLLSIGQTCDANCTAFFTNNAFKIYQTNNTISPSGNLIISSNWNAPYEPLYTIKLPTPSPSQPSSSSSTPIHHHTMTPINNPTICNKVAFYHGTMFSPPINTCLNVYKNLTLTVFLFSQTKNCKIATIKGNDKANHSNI